MSSPIKSVEFGKNPPMVRIDFTDHFREPVLLWEQTDVIALVDLLIGALYTAWPPPPAPKWENPYR